MKWSNVRRGLVESMAMMEPGYRVDIEFDFPLTRTDIRYFERRGISMNRTCLKNGYTLVRNGNV